MRIERIELQGFKSFIERTQLEFGSGVAGIVGPNGCGKSNVVDAIRWVLGEQQPKTLRGKRMEDMIFNGSDGRRPAAMAEVTMTLSDISSRLSAQWAVEDTVRVTRRLYRSGDSEYLINQKTTRLRDVVDLFMDTGLNTHSFSIVEQGRIEALLTTRVEDRREVIEEAAGIMKYKTRRNEALRKLRAAQDNLDRINDIVGEVERQTRSLERQAKRASQYKEIQDRLREVDGRLLRADYAALDQHIAPKQKAYDERKREEAELRAEWSAADGAAEERRHQMALREETLGRLLTRIRDGDAEAHRLETRIELYLEQREALETAAETRKEEGNALQAELTAAAESLERARGEAERQNHTVRETEQELSRRQSELRETRSGQTAREESIEAEKSRVHELAGRFTRAEIQIQSFQDQLSSLDRRKAQVDAERARDRQRQKETQSRLESAERRSEEASAALEDVRAREAALRGELEEKTAGLARTQEAMYRLKEDLASQSSSLTALEGLARSMDGSGWKGWPGEILSPLADLMEVQPGYEIAIEAVLGERLQGAVVEGPSEVRDAVEHLRKSGAGRGALIPKDLRVRPAGGSSPPVYYEGYCPPFAAPQLKGAGILGNAADFVRAPAEFASLVRRLLDGVRVVRDFDAAISLWKRGGEVGVLVTRAGEVLHPSGITSAGTLGAGPLQRRKEIEGLKTKTAGLREEIDRAEAAREGEKEHRAGLAGMLEDCLRAAREAESDLAEIRREMEGLEAGVSRLGDGLEASHQELERMAEEGDALGESMRRTRETLDQIGKECTEAEACVRDGASALAEGREKVEQAAESVASQREALAEVRARANNRTAEVQRFEERCREIRGRMDRLGENAESDRARLEALGQSDLQARERIREIHDHRETWGTEAKDLEEAIAADQAFLRETQERARGLQDRTAALQEELEAISESLSQLKVERDLLCQRAQISYGVDLAAVTISPEEADLPDEERESLREEATSLQDRMRRMGDVNMGALSEFEQLNERYQFLKGQQEDLVSSIQTLHDTIDRINRTTRQRFKTAFDAISETFSEVFRRLFGGGRAALVLSDESNLLKTGVDIMVQPPGKKLGNILLLSAGEKALTAISLLFAIFRYHPSPFCLLDEVDATLDDHNVARFIDVLRELSLKTQFIIITHNKRTMSFADVLYGVTMIEKGVSGVVSVDLNRMSPRTEDDAPGAESGASPHPLPTPAVETDAEPSAEDRWATIEPIDESEGNGRHGPPALEKVSSIESGETNGAPAAGDGPDESETEPSEKLPAESPLPSGG